MKKIFILLFIGLLIYFFFESCNSKKKDIYLIVKTTNNTFFTEIINGAEEANKKEFDIMIKSGQREDDVQSQIKYLQIIINEAKVRADDIYGVIITPTSSKGELVPYLKQLIQFNIPIIIVDTKIESKFLNDAGIDSLPFIVSSNLKGGNQAAEAIIKTLPSSKKSNLLILNGVNGQETAEARNLGFYDVINKNPDLNFNIVERTANWNRFESMKIVSTLLSSGQKFDAIFAANDEMALGAIEAYENSAKYKLPIIIGFDAIPEAVLSIKNNKLYGTIEQNPFLMGKTSINMLTEFRNNKLKIYTNFIPTNLITK
jgi:ribose transport system substrate-binding protein